MARRICRSILDWFGRVWGCGNSADPPPSRASVRRVWRVQLLPNPNEKSLYLPEVLPFLANPITRSELLTWPSERRNTLRRVEEGEERRWMPLRTSHNSVPPWLGPILSTIPTAEAIDVASTGWLIGKRYSAVEPNVIKLKEKAVALRCGGCCACCCCCDCCRLSKERSIARRVRLMSSNVSPFIEEEQSTTKRISTSRREWLS